MTENITLLNLTRLFFERNLDAASQILESMTEEEAVAALKSLPAPPAALSGKVFLIGFAATIP